MEISIIVVTLGDRTLLFVLYIAESKPFQNVLCLSRAHDGDFG